MGTGVEPHDNPGHGIRDSKNGYGIRFGTPSPGSNSMTDVLAAEVTLVEPGEDRGPGSQRSS